MALPTTPKELLEDYRAALAMARGDAIAIGAKRWLSNLVALAPVRAKRYPKLARHFIKAAREASEGIL